MRKLTTVTIASLTLLLAFAHPQSAQAHVLERDGQISAVLHMPPEDAPVAGQTTTINLAFASGDRNFTIANYTISLSVKRAERVINTQTMQSIDRSDTDATATVTLPAAGAYQMEVAGSPKVAGNDSFNLQYDIRASSPAGQAGDQSEESGRAGFDFWAINAGIWAVLVIVARTNIRQRGRYARGKH